MHNKHTDAYRSLCTRIHCETDNNKCIKMKMKMIKIGLVAAESDICMENMIVRVSVSLYAYFISHSYDCMIGIYIQSKLPQSIFCLLHFKNGLMLTANTVSLFPVLEGKRTHASLCTVYTHVNEEFWLNKKKAWNHFILSNFQANSNSHSRVCHREQILSETV